MTLGDLYPHLKALRGYEEIAARPVDFSGPMPVRVGHFPPLAPPDGRARVGIVSPTCYIGGAELWIGQLLDHCDGSRIRWEGIAVRDRKLEIVPSVLADWEAHCPVAVGPGAIRELASRVDLLVVWGLFQQWGFPAETFAPLVGQTPILYVSHGAMGEFMVDPGDLLPGVTAAAVSRAALQGVPERLRGFARVIRNMVDPARVAPTRPVAETRAALGIPGGARVAGWLGRFACEKRPEVFIEAVAALPEPWVGVAVGIGWQEDEARELAAEVAPGRVIFAGGRGDVGDLLAAFDCLCMPSLSEACSLAAAEAWAAGVSLISTRVGLLEERDDLARLIPNPPTGRDLADAILADLACPDWTRARVGRAREFAAREMAPERFGREWTDLILATVPAPKSPGLLEKAGSVLRAGVRLIADGGRLSPEELRAERLAICSTCPRMQGGICVLCGCFLQVKVTLPLESCPDTPPRWGPA